MIKRIRVSHYGAIMFMNKDGFVHRDGDYPAVIFANGDVAFYKNAVRYKYKLATES